MTDDEEMQGMEEQLALLTTRFNKVHTRKKNWRKYGSKKCESSQKKKFIGPDKSNVECYKCKKIGHYAADCRVKVAPKEKLAGADLESKYSELLAKYRKVMGHANRKGFIVNDEDWDVANNEAEDKANLFLMGIDQASIHATLCAKLNGSPSVKRIAEANPQIPSASKTLEPVFSATQGNTARQIWYLDSMCSRHMTDDKSLLVEFVVSRGPAITFGNDAEGITTGYGVISNEKISLSDVPHVDGLIHNMISFSQLCDKGNTVEFMKDICLIKVVKGGLLINGNKRANVYVLDMTNARSLGVVCYLFKGFY